MGKKEVRPQGFSMEEMLYVDNFIFNLWNAARESEDLRYPEYFTDFFMAINKGVKFRSHSTNRQKLEAKVGRAVLDHVLALREKHDDAAEDEGEE